MNTETEKTVRVLSIDAWRNMAGGWSWNDWHAVGEVPLSVCDYKPRKLLRYMRDAGFLRADSAGKGAIEDDGHNIVIMERGNRKPVFALEYGAVRE